VPYRTGHHAGKPPNPGENYTLTLENSKTGELNIFGEKIVKADIMNINERMEKNVFAYLAQR